MYNSSFFRKLPMLGMLGLMSAGASSAPARITKQDLKPPPASHGRSHKQNVKRRHKRRISSRSRAVNRRR